MIVLQIIIGVIAAVGVGFLLADFMKIPSLKASKAANSVGRKGKKKTGVIELYRRDFATKLAGKLHLNEFKRANLVIDLRTANMEITPEQYMADAIVKALMIGILAIPAFFIAVFFGFLILGIALFVYFSESKKVTRKIRQKRANIEYELPRLVGHIEKLLTHSRDIIYILESYIAVYAVKTNRTEDVVTFDDEKAEVLKEIYRRLNRMDVHTEHITVKETHLETQEDGSIVPVEQEVVKTYLYIETVPLTAEEAANLYGFDTKQREQLGELLSDKNKEMWDGLLS